MFIWPDYLVRPEITVVIDLIHWILSTGYAVQYHLNSALVKASRHFLARNHYLEIIGCCLLNEAKTHMRL